MGKTIAIRIPLIYGAIIAFGIFAWVLVMYATGFYGSEGHRTNLDLFPILIPIIGLYLGLRAQRNRNSDRLTYGEGVVTGVKISIVVALLSSLCFLFFYTVIANASLDQIGRAYGMANSSIAQIILVDLGLQFISSFIFGVLVSLVVALVLKK